MVVLKILLTCIVFNGVLAWDSEQLEVFDVVEEVKQQNFYELLNITHNADSKEIRTAFRVLSLKLHPDKNLNEDTSEQFRNLVSVYDILRSPSKRRYYDEVLVNGLPNWRSAVYYYRHVRRLGLFETCIILTVLISAAQYLIGWASYAEQKYTFEQLLVKKKKRDKEQYKFELPKPSLLNTLPIQIPRLIWWTITGIPNAFKEIKTFALQRLEEAISKPPPADEEVVPKTPKTARKRKPVFVPPEGPNFEFTPQNAPKPVNEKEPPPITGGLWTDDDLNELVQLVKRYPGGTPKRWEVIAEELNRSVGEVTFMANKIKTNNFRVACEAEEPVEQARTKQKTRAKADEASNSEKKWSQLQQKALEEALYKFPKGCLDRWDRIAEYVPGKSKEDCMLRYRNLAEAVRKQKENSVTATE